MRRTVLAAAVIACLLAAVAGLAWTAYRTSEAIRNSYAVWWVADMIVEHLQANEDQWPRNWDELRDDYQTCVRRSGQPWTFEELRSRVAVDWEADTATLRQEAVRSPAPTFRAIWLRDGTDTYWERREPNRILFEYLRSHPPAAGAEN